MTRGERDGPEVEGVGGLTMGERNGPGVKSGGPGVEGGGEGGGSRPVPEVKIMTPEAGKAILPAARHLERARRRVASQLRG